MKTIFILFTICLLCACGIKLKKHTKEQTLADSTIARLEQEDQSKVDDSNTEMIPTESYELEMENLVGKLYINCGNSIQFSYKHPGFYKLPQMSYTSSAGASTIKQSKEGMVIVMPDPGTERVTLQVVQHTEGSSGFDTTEWYFETQPIPNPGIELKVDGQSYVEGSTVNLSTVNYLDMRAMPDAGFKALMPRDARYKVTEWKISFMKGGQAVLSQQVRQQELSMADFRTTEADELFLETVSVKRLNFKGKVETVDMKTVSYSIALSN